MNTDVSWFCNSGSRGYNPATSYFEVVGLHESAVFTAAKKGLSASQTETQPQNYFPDKPTNKTCNLKLPPPSH